MSISVVDRLRELLRTHPLYVEDADTYAVHEKNDDLLIGFQTGPGNQHRGTHFSLHIQGATAYLVQIGVEAVYRGQGYGYMLYRLAEQLAAELGCTRMEMTPSGYLPHRVLADGRYETRASYVQRKLGYTLRGVTAYKNLG